MAASANSIIKSNYAESLGLLNEFKHIISQNPEITSQKSQDILQEFQDDFRLLLQLYINMLNDTDDKYESLKALKDSINDIDIEEPLFVRNISNDNNQQRNNQQRNNTTQRARVQRRITNYLNQTGNRSNPPPRPTKRRRGSLNAIRFNLIREATAKANAKEAANLERLQAERR